MWTSLLNCINEEDGSTPVARQTGAVAANVGWRKRCGFGSSPVGHGTLQQGPVRWEEEEKGQRRGR